MSTSPMRSAGSTFGTLGWPALFAATIFLSAFLLFQVQPIAGKIVLPWFGGGSNIWITTLMFFQVALLGGYAYSHLIALRLSPRAQGFVHIGLLVTAAATLPIIPGPEWRPEAEDNPTWRLLLVLLISVGPPYLLLATTGPLLQHWFATRYPNRSPYPLYALSNVGSLLALLSYPVVFERFLGLQAQSWMFAGGFVLFAAACAVLAWQTARLVTPAPAQAVHEVAETDGAEASVVRPVQVLLWAALPACASALLLAVTTQMTQDVAGLPLLWVLPLSVYLLTFIATFSSEKMYEPTMYTIVLAFACAGGVYVLRDFSIVLQISLYLLVLFLCCMSLHGETSRLRPAPKHLTVFYLMVSVGGALGGMFVALLAPVIFDGYWEYHVALLTTPVLVLLARYYDEGERRPVWMILVVTIAASGLLFVMGSQLYQHALKLYDNTLGLERSFYGVVRVYYAQPLGEQPQHHMQHGRILHGLQFLDEPLKSSRTGYYSPTTAVGLALANHPARRQRPLTVGVTGLGAGMIAAYAERGDEWSFYEIDPLVTQMAEDHFTYMNDARARGAGVEVYHGDGRTVLERQLKDDGSRQFDVLVLDAFTSDAVPVHLLTREAIAMYWQHLKPDGILAINISNAYLDLSPVIRGLAADSGHEAKQTRDPGNVPGGRTSFWFALTNNRAFLDKPVVAGAFVPEVEGASTVRWTDDYTNLYSLLTIR